MKKIAIYLLPLALLLSCSPKKKEEKKEIKSYSIEQFYKNKNIWGGSFSPDETKLLVSSNETGIFNVFALPVAGGDPIQLTNSTTDSYFAISYLPVDERLLYSSDQGGNENYHIYLRNTDGSVKDLTPYEGATSRFRGWARDRKSFFFLSNKRDHRFFDLYEMQLNAIDQDPPKAEMIYENNKGFEVAAISNDKRYLALVQSITTNNSEMYLYDLKTKEEKHLSAHEGDATYDPQFFCMSNEILYFLTNENNEFTYLSKYNLKNGTREIVYKTSWNVMYAYNSYNEKYRVIGVNDDARTKIHVFDLTTKQEVQLPEIQGGSIISAGISKSEERMRLTVGTSTSPNNIYVYDFATKEVKQLTETLNPEINKNDLVEGKVIRYKSFDGVDIPAIYYQPLVASKKHKVPALVWVHGGPGGQSRVGYFSLIQYLVNHGYAVLAVNNRGSSGYGKTFYKMDDKKHGDEDLKDCIQAKKFFESTGVIDMEKVGIIGGSYGGYMVMAALTFAPEEFDVGVNIFGVTNWLRTLKSIPPYWESFRKALYSEMGDPNTADSVALYNKSPLFFAKNVTKPLMVLQGANDVRVLKVESDEIVEAVRANNVPVEYIVFDDEGHGFLKKENEIKGYGQVKDFLDKHLKKMESSK